MFKIKKLIKSLERAKGFVPRAHQRLSLPAGVHRPRPPPPPPPRPPPTRHPPSPPSRSNGTSMISLILSPKSQISMTNKMLGDEYGTASNIKSRVK